MPTIQYSARSARLSVRLFKWTWRDDVIRPRPLRQSEVPSTGVRRRRKFEGGFLYEVYRPREWFWTDSNGKNWNYTSRAVGNEFPSICNHCGVTAAWSRKIWKKMSFLSFYGKTTPNGKIFKILFRKDSSQHRSTCCVQTSWNLADGKCVKSCVA